MIKHGFEYMIPNPKRPSPDYYKDCKRFNWADKLIASHKKHIEDGNHEDVYKIEYTPEELAILAKLKLKEGGASYLKFLTATSLIGLVYLQ